MAKSSARRRQIARAKWERQQQRRIEHETAVRTRERMVIGVVVVAVVGVLAGLGLRQLVEPNSVASQSSPASIAAPSTTLSTTQTPTATT
jgi:peptidyl-prolyl cis-trans isomerase B (cyclophilin B)